MHTLSQLRHSSEQILLVRGCLIESAPELFVQLWNKRFVHTCLVQLCNPHLYSPLCCARMQATQEQSRSGSGPHSPGEHLVHLANSSTSQNHHKPLKKLQVYLSDNLARSYKPNQTVQVIRQCPIPSGSGKNQNKQYSTEFCIPEQTNCSCI